MHRPLAGAVAALITATALYPLDTYKVSRQTDRHIPTRGLLYLGFKNEACATFLGTGAYFACYDAVRSSQPDAMPASVQIAFASVAGTCTACLFRSPLSLRKRRRQMRAVGVVTTPVLWPRTIVRAYGLDVSRSIPKTVVKYIVYERLFSVLQRICSATGAAAVAGAVAAALSHSIALIFDVKKTRLLAAALPRGAMARSFLPSMLQTIASNSLGHALMETFYRAL